MDGDKIREMKVALHNVKREYDGFFKLNKLSASHERYQGGMQDFSWEVFERGNAVAVILYKKDSKEIILVRQFRAPTLRYVRDGGGYRVLNDGQLDETIAGMPRGGETPEDCAVREVYEETGYRIMSGQLQKIAEFYVSPGGTSERILLYYSEVTEANRDPKRDKYIGGEDTDHESILIRHIPVSTFFSEMINPNDKIDSKVLIASMLLRERLSKIPTDAEQPALPGAQRYTLKNRANFSIVLRTGNMLNIADVDAWVNSENTDMEMDRFIGTSVSALIRYYGAAKDGQGRVLEDTIADALKAKMRGRYTSHIGTVHDTTPGELRDRNNVRRLFHVAAVTGAAGKGAKANPELIDDITFKALAAIERRNNAFGATRCESALLPMIGAGDQGLSADIVCPKIIEGIMNFFELNRSAKLKSVHLSAYRQYDAGVAKALLDAHPQLTRDGQ